MKGTPRAWKRSGVLVAGAAAGFVGLGLCALPASAHTPVWSVTCSEVTVDLKGYQDKNDKVTNTVTITVDGKDLLPTKKFGSAFSDKLTLPDHSAELEVRLVVEAGDGDQFDVDETKTAPVCESPKPSGTPEPSSSPEPSGPGTPTQTPVPSEPPSSGPAQPSEPGSPEPGGTGSPEPSEPAESGSSTAPAVPTPASSTAPSDEDLAATGGSSTTPVIAGAAAVVLLAGGGILVATRKRRGASD